jgi:hypothetical protein
MGDRVAEQCHQSIAQLLGDPAAHLCHCRGGGVEIGAHEVAPFLRVEPCGDAGRVHQIREHHGDMAALARGIDGSGRRRRLRGRAQDRAMRLGGCLDHRRCGGRSPSAGVQSGNGTQELAAMAQRGDTDLL